ncbi:hypothetical protein P170DRAFT_476574 [Aspergillus steynii IBT 23096]|uniref:Uncharacterized protein n=1 Tax=Aspergillus steynii IBT 23096 TaxID=1392250 RepID=A0A2I2G4W9_9EURO|nr:uncharacterized protein P170DRAFT_476574 [Aspergillus steynii IBT 23096]PLB47921.1 hypothetical protein P170DRAFT_476574 [Aspergillus steynii IBT 23096]
MNVQELVKREWKPNAIINEASFFRDPGFFHAFSVLENVNRALLVGDHKQLSPPTFPPEGERIMNNIDVVTVSTCQLQMPTMMAK